MNIFVFVGPTLSAADVKSVLEDAVCLPPVAQGDIVRNLSRDPKAFGIIDGFFERVPAVWHKEILWAMEHGVHVFGSASMGALRAAELHPFGMVGVGRIFEDFRDGVLEDDDEVAVIHGPADSGYVGMSEAMVNIRRTLAKAAEEGVIGRRTEGGLLDIAKRLFYPLRDYRRIVREASEAGYPAEELSALALWVKASRVDQKREDALAMLRHMKGVLSKDEGPKRVDYQTEYTEFFDDLMRQAGTSVSREDEGYVPLPFDLLMDDIRLDPETFFRVQRETAMRGFVLTQSRQDRKQVSEEMVERTLTEFRRRWGLTDDASLDNWIALNDIDRATFEIVIQMKATADYFYGVYTQGMRPEMVLTMVLNNEYYKWAQYHEHKQAYLRSRGLDNPSPQDVGLTPEDLVEWYFRGQNMPMPNDIQAYLESLGFRDVPTFLQAVIRDYAYKNM
jgi:hypothetical protein